MAPQCGEERELISLLWCLVQALGGRCICALGRGTELEAQVWGSEDDELKSNLPMYTRLHSSMMRGSQKAEQPRCCLADGR